MNVPQNKKHKESPERKMINNRPRRMGSPEVAAAARQRVALPNSGVNYLVNRNVPAYNIIPMSFGPNYQPKPIPAGQKMRYAQPAPVAPVAPAYPPVNRNVKPNQYNYAAHHEPINRERLLRRMLSHDNAHMNKPVDPMNDFDVRLIIFRHGERLDQCMGRDWYDQTFDVDNAPPEAYKNPALPKRLPLRTPSLLYQYDPPLSAKGQQDAMFKGQHMERTGFKVDLCFSSPASRSVLTADALLQGMNQLKVPICIDPHLFEPMNWNLPLKDLHGRNPFLTPEDWKTVGVNTDLRYQDAKTHLRTYGTEHDYYDRSKNFFDTLSRHVDSTLLPLQHQRGRKQITILIVGHSATARTLAYIARNRKLDVQTLFEQCKGVPYLYSAVIQRNPTNKEWLAEGMFNLPMEK